jgi:transaldolase
LTTLHDLYRVGGQSPWIDDLKRSYVRAGGLEDLIVKGIRGVTSNPTIMARSIQAGTDYDEQFASIIGAGGSVDDAYWDLVIDDVTRATHILRPVYDESKGGDGYVSIEVAPGLANDTGGTIAAARALHERIAQPNLYVKIPATKGGLPAIEQMISEGRSINVTLIFSLQRYEEVVDAYMNGLERFVAGGGDPSNISSVASFFVSRVDTEVDHRLETIAAASGSESIATKARAAKGKSALAQARLAYTLFTERFNSTRFAALEKVGARRQRPLWASTSTKDPSYPDLLYVDGLIGPDTVDTMPDATVDAFLDHGHVARTIDSDPMGSRACLDEVSELGVDLDDVTDLLEREGVASFSKSFDELIDQLAHKASELNAR